jgi:hypothetical protein
MKSARPRLIALAGAGVVVATGERMCRPLIMERKMLRGIKERAERLATGQSSSAPSATRRADSSSAPTRT